MILHFKRQLETSATNFSNLLNVYIDNSVPLMLQYFFFFYLKAWQNSSGTFRSRVEDDCIQDLMYHGILANRTLPKSRQIVEPSFYIIKKLLEERNCHEIQVTFLKTEINVK